MGRITRRTAQVWFVRGFRDGRRVVMDDVV